MKTVKKNRRKILIVLAVVVSVIVVSNLLVMAASAFVESRSIGLGNAIDLSLYNANVEEADAEITRAKLTLKGGTFLYSIKFRSGNTLYEYEIAADDGEVLNVSVLSLDQSQTGSTGTVTLEQAKSAALADAMLSEADVVFTSAKLDRDDGAAVYDIEFTAQTATGTCYYEYEVLASTGAVAKRSTSQRLNQIPGSAIGSADRISQDEAKNAALTDAGLTSEQVTMIRAELDMENGAAIYEVEFSVSTETARTKYEYEILATDGTLLKREVESRMTSTGVAGGTDTGATDGTTTGGSTSDGAVSTGEITIDAAKEIALKDAGLTSSQVYFKKAKLDRDDGRTVYEVEFVCNGYEYEYEIDYATGAILERDVERDD